MLYVGWSVAQRPTHRIIGDDFYWPDDETNSVKALKETSRSSRSGLNPTRTTPPCYNNTTLRNRLYTRRKGPNVTNPICWTCENCSCKCAADCEHCVTQSSTEQFFRQCITVADSRYGFIQKNHRLGEIKQCIENGAKHWICVSVMIEC